MRWNERAYASAPFNAFYAFIRVCGCVIRTAIGIKAKDGVVLAVEKLVQSKLLVPGSNKRIQSADYHIGVVSIWTLWDLSWNSALTWRQ
jgi:hypothetical protein